MSSNKMVGVGACNKIKKDAIFLLMKSSIKLRSDKKLVVSTHLNIFKFNHKIGLVQIV